MLRKAKINHVMIAAAATALALASIARADEYGEPSWLFVHTASSFSVDKTTLIIPYEREIFGFTDRPNRLHAYLNAHEMSAMWNMGKDDFTQNPPNAVMTWVDGGEIKEAELLLTSVSVDTFGRSISYNIVLESGHLPIGGGQEMSLFIDDFFNEEAYCETYKISRDNQIAIDVFRLAGNAALNIVNKSVDLCD